MGYRFGYIVRLHPELRAKLKYTSFEILQYLGLVTLSTTTLSERSVVVCPSEQIRERSSATRALLSVATVTSISTWICNVVRSIYQTVSCVVPGDRYGDGKREKVEEGMGSGH